ncbi:MAG: hypothetical protein J0I98_06510 [Mesorhizobium sp.]|nr:hypothetical protein [Mesorhizobium sp.]MBN9242428.1 hypothetical protein [Mesorhizobium sp.]
MRTAVLIGLAMLFAAESWASERFDLSEDAIASVQAAVTSVLKDPDSATFSDLAAAKSPAGDIFVCGKVNAKNSFGGYSGAAPFIGTLTHDLKKFVIERVAETGDEMARVIVRCRAVGAMGLY